MEKALLAGIVGSAFATRAIALWLTRPEFVGWFNHSYYYWVQVKAILTSGRLPYDDLPLIFYLYGALARFLQLFGQDMQLSIVNASRFTMSIAPALIAVPVYLITKRINGNRSLGVSQWLLVVVAAFLPLSFVHMPELLQKNTLGLFLISLFIYATYELLRDRSTGRLIVVILLFALIAFTHLGTLAVTLLYGASMLLALLFNRSEENNWVTIGLLLVALSIAGMGTVYLLDPDAFARIIRYAQSSLPNSLTGRLFSSDPVVQKLAMLAGILLPLSVVSFLVRIYNRHRDSILPVDRTFWLANLLLAYALVLPILNLEIVPRLVLFAPLPLLVVLNYHLLCNRSSRINALLVGLASLGVAVMILGETMGLIRLYPNKDQMHQELLSVKAHYQLTEDDFVLTTYGANPICNWFLGSKSGLITAFNRNDWHSYKRVFVLNTMERRASGRSEGERREFRTASERFEVMRQDIPLPADLRPAIDYEFLEFHELQTVPGSWLFDADGNWIGWRE